MNPVNRGIIALDLDGTLLAPDHQTVPKEARRALRDLADAGWLVVPASGRPLQTMMHELDQVPAKWAVTSNGAAVWKLGNGGEIVHLQPMASKTVKEVYALLQGRDCSIELFQRGLFYLEESRVEAFQGSLPDFFSGYLSAYSTVVPDLAPYMERDDTEKLTIAGLSPQAKAELYVELEKIEGLALTTSIDDIEITAAGVTKASALEWLAGHLGLEAGDVIAFGDSDNDKEMLAWAGLSFAMPKASPAAAEAADSHMHPEQHLAGVLTSLVSS
jgi:Cof subfamily protein (haloacid dehalogenase superfamily)